MILDRNGDPKNLEPMLETFLKYGIDTIMAPFGVLPHIMRAIQTVQERTGKGFILIDTPTMNVDNNTLSILQAVAANLGVTYLDVSPAVCTADGTLPADASGDGIHLSAYYTKLWVNYLESHPIS